MKRAWIVAALVLVTALVAGCGGGGSGSSPQYGSAAGRVGLSGAFPSSSPAARSSGLVKVPRSAGGVARTPALFSEEDADGVIVKFKPSVSTLATKHLAADLGVTKERSLMATGAKVWKLGRGRSIAETVTQLRSRNDVEYAEPNRRNYKFAVPNDTLYDYQWHYGKISLPTAWDITTGSTSVIVAVIDSGIRPDHPDLNSSQFVAAYDFVDGDTDPTDLGETENEDGPGWSHGTHVAGTIGALTNNSQGVAGVNWRVRLMPLRVLGTDGSASDADLAEAIYWAADHGAQVINMSLGRDGAVGKTLGDAITYAHDRGVVLVAAAGNDNKAVGSPASHPYVIAVGATDAHNNRASYSNYGPELSLVAPGGDYADLNSDGYWDDDNLVISTGWNFTSNQSVYIGMAGTSMASPHVAGLAALMIANGITGPDFIKAQLQNTAQDLGAPGWDPYYGWGLINAPAALGLLAKAQVLIFDDQDIAYRGTAKASGAFTVTNVRPGTWYVGAWIDSNENEEYDEGDYLGVYPDPVLISAGRTTGNLNFELEKLTADALSNNTAKSLAGRLKPRR